jgi:hypothetical protein
VTFSLTGIIVGVLTGLLVTVLVTMLWPQGKLRWARPLLSAGLGFGVALLLMKLIK